MIPEIYDRYRQVPREIMDQSLHNIYIHATIRQWIDSDQTVDQLLVKLVLLLSDQMQEQDKTIRKLIAERPSATRL